MTSGADTAAFFRNASSPMAILGREGEILELNSGWERLIGSAARRGKPFTDLVSEQDASRVTQALQATGRDARGFEARLRPDAAKRGWVVRFDASRTEDGTLLLVGSVLGQDLEALDAEREVREKLAQFDRQSAMLAIVSRALATAPLILWATDRHAMTTHVEGLGLSRLGMKPSDVIGKTSFELYKDFPEILNPIKRALAGEELSAQSSIGPMHFQNWYAPLRTADGALDGCIGLTLDITERARTEAELRDKLELIERQSATIRELATPIIQVWEDVLCMPIIGTVDSVRTADMMTSLLDAIVRQSAQFAIIDLTGVEVVDTATADHILKLLKAAQMLGVEGLLCGIRPAVAQTVVSIGVDLGAVKTVRSLKDALRWCIGRLQGDVVYEAATPNERAETASSDAET